MTRVLVTGATGFVGRPLVRALASAGFAVRAAGRTAPRFEDTAIEAVAHGDLGASIAWEPLVAGVDAVVHLAGIAHTGDDIADATYDRVNHRATAELAAAARRAGVQRFVLLSSIRAQSGPSADHVLTETDAPHPTDAYGRSKLAAEAAVRGADVAYTILRPVLIYGPGAKGNLAALARLTALPIPLPFGALSARRSLLCLDNLVSAVHFVLTTPSTANETFIVCDPEPVTVTEILTAYRAGFGRPRALLPVPPALLAAVARMIGRGELWARLSGDLVADPAKLIAAGWRPRRDTRAALTRMAAARAG